MKIGIVIYSKTGNTLSVAEKLGKKLESAGHKVAFERINVSNDEEWELENIRFTSLPNPEGYDALVVAAPVQAFGLCRVMKAYLPKLPKLNGKNVVCLTTEGFPAPWLGGNKAIATLKKACEAQGAKVVATGIVNWMKKSRESQIEKVVTTLAAAF